MAVVTVYRGKGLWAWSPQGFRWPATAEPLVHRPDMRGPSGCHGRGDRLPLRARAVAAFGGQAAWQAPPPPTRRPDDVSVGERQGEWRRPVGWGAGAGLPRAAHAACVWTHGPVGACHPGGLADPTDRCRRPRRFDRGRGAVDEAGP